MPSFNSHLPLDAQALRLGRVVVLAVGRVRSSPRAARCRCRRPGRTRQSRRRTAAPPPCASASASSSTSGRPAPRHGGVARGRRVHRDAERRRRVVGLRRRVVAGRRRRGRRRPRSAARRTMRGRGSGGGGLSSGGGGFTSGGGSFSSMSISIGGSGAEVRADRRSTTPSASKPCRPIATAAATPTMRAPPAARRPQVRKTFSGHSHCALPAGGFPVGADREPVHARSLHQVDDVDDVAVGHHLVGGDDRLQLAGSWAARCR